jgi:hypothetical protein
MGPGSLPGVSGKKQWELAIKCVVFLRKIIVPQMDKKNLIFNRWVYYPIYIGSQLTKQAQHVRVFILELK